MLPKPSIRRRVATWIVLAAAVACGGEPDTPTPSSPPASRPSELEPIPIPDLSGADAAIREQLEPERANLDSLVAGGAPSNLLGQSFGQMGQLYHAYDLFEPAAPSYRNALRLGPDEARWHYYLGMIYHQQGRFDRAVDALEKALDQQPADAPTLLRLGRAELARDRPPMAKDYFERALAVDASCASALYGLGQAVQALGDFAAAADAFEKTLAQRPAATQVHYPLAQMLLRLGRDDEAQRHLEASASLGGAGDPPGCLDPLEAELQMLATGAPIYLARGLEAGNAGLYDLEVAEYRKAVSVAPDDPLALQSLGFALARRGEVAEALSNYRRAAELDPDNADLHYDLGVLLLRSGRADEALEALRRALTLRPNFLEAETQTAAALASLRRCGDALPIFERLVAGDSADRQVRTQHALCLAQLGRPTEAISELGRLLESQPEDDPAEYLRLAAAIGALGRPDMAIEYLETFTSTVTDPALRAQGHLQIAVLLQRTSDRQRAVRHLDAALQYDPGLQPARELLDRLTGDSR